MPPLAQLLRDEQAAKQAWLDARAQEPAPIGLDRVQLDFRLGDIERHVLLLATSLTLGRSLGELLGELEGGFPDACTVESVFAFAELDLEGRVDARQLFRPTATLFANDLATMSIGRRFSTPDQLLESTVSITSRGLELVLGSDALAEELLAFSKLERPRATFDAVVLPVADRARLLAVVDRRDRVEEVSAAWGVDAVVRSGRGTLILLAGPPGTGKTTTAHAIADRLGTRILQVDIPTFASHGDAARFLPGLFRESRLHDALLFFDECETLFASRRSGNSLMSMLLTELERFEGIAVLATNLPQVLDEALDRRILVRLDFPHPDIAAREALWRLHVPERAVTNGTLDLAALARRHDLTGGHIKNAMLAAVATAVAEHPEAPVLRQEHLDAAARDQARRVTPSTDGVGLRDPRSALRDVVLAPEALRAVQELVDAGRVRHRVFEKWGVGARHSGGRALVAMFHGPPGTGKSVCAEAVAGELGRPLLQITLPAILSRWVGEAEQALARAFRAASSADAVLLLDEADALLMARGEGRASRHDDGLVTTLLSEIDRFDGVVVLTTNRPAVLDAALRRRVAWSVTFGPPDASCRASIWQTVLPPAAIGGVAIDLRGLARDFELTGGQIRNAAVRAAVRAAVAERFVEEADLVEAAAEEAGFAPGATPRSRRGSSGRGAA